MTDRFAELLELSETLFAQNPESDSAFFTLKAALVEAETETAVRLVERACERRLEWARRARATGETPNEDPRCWSHFFKLAVGGEEALEAVAYNGESYEGLLTDDVPIQRALVEFAEGWVSVDSPEGRKILKKLEQGGDE